MDGEQPASILLKIKPWLESGGPFQPRESAAADEEGERSFSALDMRDRVVVALLEEEVVDVDQVETAWKKWKSEKQGVPDALWRVAAQLPSVNGEAVFATAAEVYAFEPITSLLHRSRALMEEYRGHFSVEQRRQLLALNVLPVTTEETREGPCWLFASHDPARPAVYRLLAEVDVPAYDLRYAPAADVRSYLEEIFPSEARPESPEADGKPVAPEPKAASSDAESATPESPTSTDAAPSPLYALLGDGEVPKRSARGRETARTFASIYEELIAGVARSGAWRVRLSAKGKTQLAATFDYAAPEKQRRVELEVPPAAVFSFMRRRTRSTRRSGTDAPREVHRWVEGQRHSFRIAALPGRTRWRTGRGEIVIEAVD